MVNEMDSVKVIISPDKMAAYVILPEEGDFSVRELTEALSRAGVVFGISPNALRSALSGKRGVPYQVAWGLRPEEPKDFSSSGVPVLVSRFPQSRGKPPRVFTVDEDFRSKWGQLLARGSVREGSVLAFVRNPDNSAIGTTVTGEKVAPFAKKPEIVCGENASLSRDGNLVLAKRSGIPYTDEGGPAVLDRVEIVGNIGSLTGDVHFPGDIVIKGDVSRGFKVTAWGAVMITGTLAGSVSCAGNIVVEGGIKSTGEIVESGGEVSARFCENSVVRAIGDVVFHEAVVHSLVETEKRLIVTHEKGKIVGGLVRAKAGVKAPTVGSLMGVPTVVEVGISPKLRREYSKLKDDLDSVRSEIERIARLGLASRSRGNNRQYDSLRLQRMRQMLEDKERSLREKIASLEDMLKSVRGGFFWADEVLPGTKLVVGLETFEYRSPAERLRIGVIDGEIR